MPLHSCDLRTEGAEVGRLGIQGQCGPHKETLPQNQTTIVKDKKPFAAVISSIVDNVEGFPLCIFVVFSFLQ